MGWLNPGWGPEPGVGEGEEPLSQLTIRKTEARARRGMALKDFIFLNGPAVRRICRWRPRPGPCLELAEETTELFFRSRMVKGLIHRLPVAAARFDRIRGNRKGDGWVQGRPEGFK